MTSISTEDGDRYRAPALDKGLDILELLATTEHTMTQAEMAKALNRSPNEFYRMLDRLVRRGYVRRTLGDRYALTLKLFELAHGTPPMRRLVSGALPVMQRFAREAQQSCHLVVLDRNVLVVVAQVDGPGYWNVSIRVGARVGMVNTGSGHVFLAFSSREERLLMLEDGGTDPEERLTPALQARLRKVRAQGHESMVSEQVAGVTNLSVPVFGPTGGVLAALTCAYMKRLDKTDAPGPKEALELLRVAAGEVSQSNGEAQIEGTGI